MPLSDAVTSLLCYVGPTEELVREASAALAPGDHEVSVTTVASDEAAMDRLARAPVDCLLIEADRPSGVDLIEHCSDEHPALACLALCDTDEQVNEALAAGASDVFVRRDGVDGPALLARRLEGVLDQSERTTVANEELRRERDFSDLLLDTVDDVFYLIDPDGKLERWNEQLRTVTGYTDAELDGMDALEFFEGEDRARVETAISDALETGSASVAVGFVTKAGETIPYEFTGAKLTDEHGDLRGVVGIGRDVSERRELQQEIRRKASLLEHIFHQVPTALYVKDTEGRHIRMSEHHEDPHSTLGKTDPEVYGDTEFARRAYEDDRRVIEDGERIINKEEYNPSDEEWTLTSKVPWYDEHGDVQGLIGVSRVITEKKEYQRELRLRNRAMEEAPVGITLHDATDGDPRIVDANDSFASITGYDHETVEGERFGLLAGEETDPEQIDALETAFADGEATSLVALLYRADGTPFWGRISTAPVTDDEGELTHFVGFLQDVTETREHAERIERRLDEFGDLIAAELRSPLQNAETAVESLRTDGSQTDIEDAVASLQRVDKLIDDLAAVHSFSVKSRSVFETTATDPGGDE